MDLQRAVDQAKTIVTATVDAAKYDLDRGEPKDAKRVLASGQRELRDLKREVTNAERDMRAEFQQSRLKIDRGGQVLGAFGGSKARGVLARGRAFDKRNLAANKAAVTDNYRRVKSIIDDFVAQLDNLKFRIDSAISQQDASRATRSSDDQGSAVAKTTSPSTPPPPPPPPTPASWRADPFGRHELRYWDGAGWTEHVSDAGIQGVDQPD